MGISAVKVVVKTGQLLIQWCVMQFLTISPGYRAIFGIS
jgi:hypothetical protein